MAASDALPVPRKNTAYRHYFVILDADGDPVTSAVIDSGLVSGSGKALVSKDGGASVNSTNSVVEIDSGWYYLDLTSAEMNYDAVAAMVRTTTTDAKNTPFLLFPAIAGDVEANADAASSTLATSAAQANQALEATVSAGFAAGALDATGAKEATVSAGFAAGATAVGVAGVQTTVNSLQVFLKGDAVSAFDFIMMNPALQKLTLLAVTGQISKDGGAFAALTNAVTEVGLGHYKVDITAAEMNANGITLVFQAAGARDTDIHIVTQR